MHQNTSGRFSAQAAQLPSLFCWVRQQSSSHTRDIPWKKTVAEDPVQDELLTLQAVSNNPDFLLWRRAEKKWGGAIPKKYQSPLGFSACSSTGLHPPTLPFLCQLPLEKLCPPCQWSIFWYFTRLFRERTFSQASELSGDKKSQYRLKPCHWDHLETLSALTSRYCRSQYHFWWCCLPIPDKAAEMPLV